MAFQDAPLLRCLPVPESYRAIEAAAENIAARPGHAGDGLVVGNEARQFRAIADIPEAQAAVIPARDESLAVRGKGDAAYPIRVSSKDPYWPAGRHIPQAQQPVAADAGELLTIRREGNGVHLAATLQAAELLAARNLPEEDVVAAASRFLAVRRKGHRVDRPLVSLEGGIGDDLGCPATVGKQPPRQVGEALLERLALHGAAGRQQTAENAGHVGMALEEGVQFLGRQSQLRRRAAAVERGLEALRGQIDRLLVRIADAEALHSFQVASVILVHLRQEDCLARMQRTNGIHNLSAEDDDV